MGYGVIGSPADSGSASLGSSPGTPALPLLREGRRWTSDRVQPVANARAEAQKQVLAPSSSGLGRRPLKAVARVRIPSGLHSGMSPSAESADGLISHFPWGPSPQTPRYGGCGRGWLGWKALRAPGVGGGRPDSGEWWALRGPAFGGHRSDPGVWLSWKALWAQLAMGLLGPILTVGGWASGPTGDGPSIPVLTAGDRTARPFEPDRRQAHRPPP